MVGQCPTFADQRPHHASSQQNFTSAANAAIKMPSAAAQAVPSGLSLVGAVLRARGLSETAGKILLASWKPATVHQYDSQLAKWQLFCTATEQDPYQVSENALMNFLATLQEHKLKKSTIVMALE